MQSYLHTEVPIHLALIPDGNGRWATRRGLPRSAGHRRGLERVEEVVLAAPTLGVGTLSLFAFSRLNWRRPPPEVSFLMEVFTRFFERAAERAPEEGIRVTAIGRRSRIPVRLRNAISRAEAATAAGDRMELIVAVDYSSSDPGTGPVPDVDLLVRTGGERRLSDFLLREIAQAELIFLPHLWPEFRSEDLERALAEYRGRERRFGAVGSAS